MNIEKLFKGQKFKNYKELCAELGWEIKKSVDTKNAQFTELERYCNFSKIGHKITIDEIYETPLPKIENRGKSEGSRNNNNVYGEAIQLLILDLLAQCKNGKVSISRGKLMLVINMINENYTQCGEQVKKLSKYTEIEESVIYDFYNTCNSNFKSTVETALKNLMDKRIIWFDTVTKISEYETNKHRLATDDEKEFIMKCEKSVLNELGFKTLSDVRGSKFWRLFKTKVKELFNEDTGINYYYSAYDIVVNEEYLQEERKELLDFLLEVINRNEYKNKLNATVYSNIIENAEKRHLKSKSFNSRKTKMKDLRKKDEYIDSIKRLANLLIDNNTCYILAQVLNVELDENDSMTWEEMLLIDSSLDELFA